MEARASVGPERKLVWDVAIGVLLFSAVLVVFGLHSGSLGFYSDDAEFLYYLGGADVHTTLHWTGSYVPGRNLHILWQQAIFLLGGYRPHDLWKLHLIQALLDAITVVVFYTFVRRLLVPIAPALAAAALFAFYPNHGETHFWLSSAPMNILSTLFVLAYALAAIALVRRVQAPGDLLRCWRLCLLELLCYACAMYTYDQPFLVLLLLCGVRSAALLLGRPLFRTTRGLASLILLNAACILLAAFDVHLKLNPSFGPKLSSPFASSAHIRQSIWYILTYHLPRPLYRQELLTFLQVTTPGEICLAAVVASLVACGFALALWKMRAAEISPVAAHPAALSSPRASWFLLTALLGLALAAAAYGPNCIWTLAPRHNYLPTVGLALAAGSLAAAALASCKERPGWVVTTVGSVLFAVIAYKLIRLLGAERGTAGLAVAVVVLAALNLSQLWQTPHLLLRHLTVAALVGWCAITTFSFVGASLAEKKVWIDNYKIRKSFYGELAAEPALPRSKVVIFRGFPGFSPGNVVPFFLWEPDTAIRYLCPDCRVLEGTVNYTVFLGQTSECAFGDVRKPLTAYAPEEVLEVVFKDMIGRKIVYTSRSRS